MLQISSTVTKKLTIAGLRITPARRVLLTALSTSPTALSISDMIARSDIDQATVYRNITPLLQAGVIEEILLPNNQRRYSLQHEHHEHVICTSCQTIEHIACTAPTLPNTSSFPIIKAHKVVYYGLCKHCF